MAPRTGLDAMIQMLADHGATARCEGQAGRTPMTFAEGMFLAVQPPVPSRGDRAVEAADGERATRGHLQIGCAAVAGSTSWRPMCRGVSSSLFGSRLRRSARQAASHAAGAPGRTGGVPAPHQALLKHYCITCHNDADADRRPGARYGFSSTAPERTPRSGRK